MFVIAVFDYIRNGKAYYKTFLDSKVEAVDFEIPVSDMGTATFGSVMEGALLIRWIKEE